MEIFIPRWKYFHPVDIFSWFSRLFSLLLRILPSLLYGLCDILTASCYCESWFTAVWVLCDGNIELVLPFSLRFTALFPLILCRWGCLVSWLFRLSLTPCVWWLQLFSEFFGYYLRCGSPLFRCSLYQHHILVFLGRCSLSLCRMELNICVSLLRVLSSLIGGFPNMINGLDLIIAAVFLILSNTSLACSPFFIWSVPSMIPTASFWLISLLGPLMYYWAISCVHVLVMTVHSLSCCCSKSCLIRWPFQSTIERAWILCFGVILAFLLAPSGHHFLPPYICVISTCAYKWSVNGNAIQNVSIYLSKPSFMIKVLKYMN